MSIFYSLLADLQQLHKFMLQREWSDSMRWINKKSIIRRRGVTITIRWACSETETCVRKARLLPEADSVNATCTRPDAEKKAIDSQTKCLCLHKLSSSNFSNHNILPVIIDSGEATFWHTTQPLVLSDFRELKRLCCQTSYRNTTKEPKTL